MMSLYVSLKYNKTMKSSDNCLFIMRTVYIYIIIIIIITIVVVVVVLESVRI